MSTYHPMPSHAVVAAHVQRARVVRSRAILGLIRGAVSLIRRHFPSHSANDQVSHTPVRSPA